MMGTFARAVITGFGFSLGSALYKKFSKQLGLEEPSKETTDPDAADGDPTHDHPTAQPSSEQPE